MTSEFDPTLPFPDPRRPDDHEPVVKPIAHELARIERHSLLLNDIKVCRFCGQQTQVAALDGGTVRALGGINHKPTCPHLQG